MVWPLIGAGLAGVAGGVVGSIFGGGKKGEIHATKEHFAPVNTDARSISKVFAPTYQYQIESPNATITSKKDISSSARSDPDVSASRSEEDVEGTDLTKIAIIGAVAFVGYGVVKEIL